MAAGTLRPERTPPRVRLPRVTTAGEWRRAARGLLRDGGLESPAAEADAIIGHVLGLGRAGLAAERDRVLAPPERRRLSRLLHKRLERIPLQYLLGTVDFAGVCLRIRRGVFIPRPETEGLVERVLAFLEPHPDTTVVDVGTGSGAIALAVAAGSPGTRVVATDRSPVAIRLARANARRLGLSRRVRFLTGDLTDPLAALPRRPRVRVLVSNPPYIAPEERPGLAPEVAEHEPAEALFAGNRGLRVIEDLLPRAAGILETGGLLALEIGEGQGDRVAARLRGAGDWNGISIETDLAGRTRYALARRADGVR